MAARAPSVDPKTSRRSFKHRDVRDWLLRAIEEGALARGAMLPSEHQLTERFGVSRVTVRQALDDLQRRGIIEKRHGKGSFVTSPRVVESLERLLSFRETLEPLGLVASTRVLAFEHIAADKCLAQALQVTFGQVVTRIVRERKANADVVSISESCFVKETVRRLSSEDLAGKDLLTVIERELKIELSFADVTIDVGPARTELAALLGIGAQENAIRVVRTIHDAEGRPMCRELIVAKADRMAFSVRLPRF